MITTNSLDAKVLIDALDGEGLIGILAEPTLMVVSGETVSFLAKGEFAILVPRSNSQVTIEFKKFGVSLAFTPTLLDADRISMRVRPEVSELSSGCAVTIPVAGGTLTIPAMMVRQAETTAELGSGQGFAIAGLIRNSIAQSV